MKKTEKRLITLSDGTTMGGVLLVFETDAPAGSVVRVGKNIHARFLINGS